MKRTTTVFGTPQYLAPEIINNTGHDKKVNIWRIDVFCYSNY